MDKVIEFTKRRFPTDCHWLDGNCFFYAQACKFAFDEGEVLYNVIEGHFIFKLQDKYYDWSGQIEPKGVLVPWDKFEEYDAAQYKVIVRDCIK